MHLWLVCSLLSRLLFVSVSFAQSPEDLEKAKQLYKNGQILFEEDNYTHAIIAWEQGYALSKLPGFLKNIAIAYEKQEKYAEAIDTLNQYRAVAPAAEQDELKIWWADLDTKKQAQELEQRRAELLADREKFEEEQEAKEQQRMAELEKQQTQAQQRLAEEQRKANHLQAQQQKQKHAKRNTWYGVGSTSAFIAGASVYTLKAHNIYTKKIIPNCDVNSGLCLSVVQEQDSFSQLSSSQKTATILWGMSVLGASYTIWQGSSGYMTLQPNGFLLQGEF